MIPETVIHRFIQFPLNVRLLIRAALDAADQIIRIRKRPEDLIFIFLLKTGDQRNRRMPPPDAIRFLQERIQRTRLRRHGMTVLKSDWSVSRRMGFLSRLLGRTL